MHPSPHATSALETKWWDFKESWWCYNLTFRGCLPLNGHIWMFSEVSVARLPKSSAQGVKVMWKLLGWGNRGVGLGAYRWVLPYDPHGRFKATTAVAATVAFNSDLCGPSSQFRHLSLRAPGPGTVGGRQSKSGSWRISQVSCLKTSLVPCSAN